MKDGLGLDDEMEERIDWKEKWLIAIKYKRLILRSVLGAAILAAGISLLIPNSYRAETLIASAQEDDSKSSGLSSALGSMGGLASLAGVSLGGGGSLPQNIAVLKSREFLWQFAQKNNLMPILFKHDWDAEKKRWENDDPKKQPGQWDLYRLMISQKVLDVQVEKKTDLVTIAVVWTDPALAAKLANDLVAQLNSYLAQQAIERSQTNLKYLNAELAHTQVEEMRKMLFDIIASEQKNALMANTQKEYAFKVLDPAAEPDRKVKPKRAWIVLISALIAGLISLSYAIAKEGYVKRKLTDLAKLNEHVIDTAK